MRSCGVGGVDAVFLAQVREAGGRCAVGFVGPWCVGEALVGRGKMLVAQVWLEKVVDVYDAYGCMGVAVQGEKEEKASGRADNEGAHGGDVWTVYMGRRKCSCPTHDESSQGRF